MKPQYIILVLYYHTCEVDFHIGSFFFLKKLMTVVRHVIKLILLLTVCYTSIFSKFTHDHSIFNLKASKEFFFLGGSHDSGDSFPPILTAGEILEVDVGALT